ncbi:hypothetical protein [uncultured Roseivirga sp.]|uniref:hypothetical protein n=1 Tax=uncultured Roseivirga sp. TaxID=543088 RepID=UPI000D7B57AD|nr:hypothetical protein [uncultured Roseivirga sp.]PWL30678.1 MAG: hypothetical protein DCO95_04155 [Roseivirga sp. XM-24bin3]
MNYNQDWFLISNFLTPKIKGSILLKNVITEIDIGFYYQKTYGNECLKFYFETRFDEQKRKAFLDFNQVYQKYFNGLSEHVFQVHQRANNIGDLENLRFYEFKVMYMTIISLLEPILENLLSSAIKINIKSIEDEPLLNYSEIFLKKLIGRYSKTHWYLKHEFDSQINQHFYLHKLSIASKEHYRANKKDYLVKDNELADRIGIELHELRQLIIDNNIKIKVVGKEQIRSIEINKFELKRVFVQKLSDAHVYNQIIDAEIWFYRLVEFYQSYLVNEYAELVNVAYKRYFDQLSLNEQDIGQLNNGRLVVIASIKNHGDNFIMNYYNLKNDLSTGSRCGSTLLKNLKSYLPKQALQNYIEQNVLVKKRQFEKWFFKHKKPFELEPFNMEHSLFLN